MTRLIRAAAIASVIALGNACSSLDSTVPNAVPIEQTTFATALAVDLSASTKLASGMYVRDLVVGSGAAVVNGQTVTARYTGWLANGAQFDSNTTTGYAFVLGTGRVILGWDIGIPGMKVGGKRQLIVPATLGYGSTGNGPIPGNAVIVFNVEIVSVQ
ncbi:MAG: FKBP-type peptidyl-prolyl cis-trans isomerase [Gemmatimonadales bacterium]